MASPLRPNRSPGPAAESQQGLKQNQLRFSPEPLTSRAVQTLSAFNYVWADYPVANEMCYAKTKTLLFPSLTFFYSVTPVFTKINIENKTFLFAIWFTLVSFDWALLYLG